jgi:hypothetical protein
MTTFRQLDADAITRTLEETCERIRDRFPDSNLRRLAEQLHAVSLEAVEVERYLHRPNWGLRVGGGIAVVVLIALLVIVGARTLNSPAEMTLADLLQSIEAGINDAVFFGIAVFFFTTVESRVKRRRALAMLHQLTKDPERLMSRGDAFQPGVAKPSSGLDLAKYLDFCSELLSLISKIAALLVQRFDDSVVLASVNEIETLSTGLSGKIWQKITILERASSQPARIDG